MPSCATAPRATLLLLAYNQERYVADAARSCCAQEGEALQIVLSDDASPAVLRDHSRALTQIEDDLESA